MRRHPSRLLAPAMAGALLLGATVSSAATVSGTLGGALSVDPSGSAGYTIPITVPPGTAGMQPSLSLSYSSNGGNGILGQGWTLQGLSSISRCPKTKAQDNAHGTIRYDADDRFCLDGQRLVAISGTYGASGTEYRTEVESFVKAVSRGTAGGGPQYWEVWTKSGQKMEYGRTTSSRVEATRQAVVRQWKLNRVQDTVGNYLTVSYTEDTVDGFAYPSRIDYSGHRQGSVTQAPYASVRFVYENRHDDLVLMQGGYKVRVDRRLTGIQTYVGSTRVSDYRLAYSATGLPQPSRIVNIKHCDGGGDCLPATTFIWNLFGSGSQPTIIYAGVNRASTVSNGSAVDYDSPIGDIDGDGRAERMPDPALLNPRAPYREIMPGDFNGDGLTDMVRIDMGRYSRIPGWSRSGVRTYVFISDGIGGFSPSGISTTLKTSGRYEDYTPVVGDFNGDGVSDFAWTKAYNGGIKAYVSLNNGYGSFGTAVYKSVKSSGDYSEYQPLNGDFNGDGLLDLAWSRAYNGGVRVYVSLGNGYGGFGAAIYKLVKSSGDYSGYASLTGDFNGDGLLDLAWSRAYNGGIRVYVSLGNGAGGFESAVYKSIQSSGDYSGYKLQVGDFNGDSYSDLGWVKPVGMNLHVYIAAGSGDGTLMDAQHSQLTASGHDGVSYRVRSGDFDGDGALDLLWSAYRNVEERVPNPNNWEDLDCEDVVVGGCYMTVTVPGDYRDYHALMGSRYPDAGRIASIASGNGSTFRLDYEPLSASGSEVYTKDSGTDLCSLPCRDVQAPVQVVKEVTQDHGDGLTERLTYRYGGAKADLAGRGFKGFRWMESTDSRTGIISRTEYRQDFPYVGQVASSSRYVGSSTQTHLGTETNTWSSLSLNGGKTRFPYISSSTAKTYELEDGSGNRAVTTVTNASRYDSHGNPTLITVTTTGAGGTYRKVTTNTYTNTTSKWHLGRLTCATVRSEAPGETAVTRTSGFAYDSTTGLLTKEVVEPGSGDIAGCASALPASDLENLTLTTTYQYDKYGNRRQATTRGSGIASRSSTTVWGERASCGAVTSNGRFPVSVSNALGHANENWHSGAFGKLLQSRDANGLESRWEYDGFGRVIRAVEPDGSQQVTQYRNCLAAGMSCPSRAVRAVLTDRTGSASVIRYLDRRGLGVRTETEGFDGAAVYQDTVYDAAGQAVRKSRPYFAGETAQWSRYTYDKLGRVKSETLPNGNLTTTNYDGLEGGWIRERRHVQTSALTTARTTVQEHDALGRVVRTTDPAGSQTSFRYTESGKQKKVTAANGSVTTRSFDPRGRMLSETDPDRGTQTYRYNALGERVSQTSARGQTVLLKYDLLGRVVRRSEPEGTTAWVYDTPSTGKGRLAQVSGPDGYLRTHAYDAIGRPTGETVTIGGERFTGSRTYDAAGRVSTVTYPRSGLVVRHEYTATGYLSKVRKNASCGTVYWTAEDVNADGQVEELLLGNGVGTTRVYDPKTGLVQSIQSGLGGTSGVQDLGYAFDGYGNLTSREDFTQEVYESFTYDPLNRLTGSTLKNAETEAVLSSKSYRYDAVGNLVNKSDVSATDYGYGAGSAGPHAVTSAGGHTYAYDASGNMVSGGGRTLTWTSFQKPRTMAKGTTRSTFEYGPERKRVQQVKVKGSVTETVTYVGGLYERVEKTGVATEHVHYIFAGGARIAVETASEAANSSAELRYLHQDHLGSVDVVTNESGAVVERLSFGAFGERRVAQGTTAWQDSALALSSSETRRGFTDHEQLDDFGLVHMNGRVYDPQLGRFLSADPFVQFALSSQGYNRYTYVNNNPLSFTDPSGYFFKSFFRKVKNLVKKVLSNKVVRIAAAAAFAYSGGGFGAEFLLGSGTDIAATLQFGITKGAVGGFGAGLIASGGDFRAGLIGGLTGAGFGWAGGTGLSVAQRVFAHGTIGGVSSELSGGKFSSGFISSAFAKVATPSVSNAIGDNVIAKTVAMATVAGTASELAGGKFGNGAMSGAFAYLYNELSQDDWAENWVMKGKHRYSRLSDSICPMSECSHADVVSTLNKVGVHPNQTRAFMPGKYYKEDVAILGRLSSPDDISTSAVYAGGSQIGIINTTFDNHIFHSGHVTRTIVPYKGSYHIQTIGVGYGRWGALNVMFDDGVWGPVDQSVANEFR